MFSRKSMLSVIVLAGLAATPLIHTEKKLSIKEVGLATATLGTLYLFNKRKPVKNFKSRFAWNKFGSLNTFVPNMWYAFADEFVGQKSKVEKTFAHGHYSGLNKIPSYGVIGTLNDQIKPLKDAASTMFYALNVIKVLKDPYNLTTWQKLK